MSSQSAVESIFREAGLPIYGVLGSRFQLAESSRKKPCGAGRNDLSGNGGGDCLVLEGDENERVSGGDGDDLVFAFDFNGDDIFCGSGNDTVRADAEDRVAANCEDVFTPSFLQAPGATPEAEVTIITGPEDFGSY
jgi:hypothetical protein